MQRIQVVDSHTGGEPTRVVVSGFPELQGTTMAERRDDFAANHDHWRTGIVLEPRGSDIVVGALLADPCDRTCQFGVIFFNNVGMLGMCGHGMMGLVETLRHLGRLEPGEARIDTPAGVVATTLQDDGQVAVRNVASYRYAKDVELSEFGYLGDIAYGGNWFYLDKSIVREMHSTPPSVHLAEATFIRNRLTIAGITGKAGAEIDHVEFFGPSEVANSKNFVLCPGGAFDRSPCGTGTSAKMACLYEDGKLEAGEIYRQESITGSVFEGWVDIVDGQIIPTIRGRAWVTGESDLLFADDDPLRWGYRN